jgi:hypothetical protein
MNTNKIKVSEYDLVSNIYLTNIVYNQTKEINLLKTNAVTQEMKINDMLARIIILEETTKNNKIELDNLKSNSGPLIFEEKLRVNPAVSIKRVNIKSCHFFN